MNNDWYIAGLHFECQACGACCSGPDEGYIWLCKKEMQIIADYLQISVSQLKKRYLKRVGFRMSIQETQEKKDCIFLKISNGRKLCGIYPVRPAQCRNWPFWESNLSSPEAWNQAAQRCPGINRGKLYSFDKIEKLRNRKKWWENATNPEKCPVTGKNG